MKKQTEPEVIQEIREWIGNLVILLAIPEKERLVKALEEIGGCYPAEHLRGTLIAIINIFMIAAKEPAKIDSFLSQLPKGNFSEIIKAKPNKVHEISESILNFITENAVMPSDPNVPNYAKNYVGSVLAILFLVHASGEGMVAGKRCLDEEKTYSEANALIVLFREAMVFARKEPEKSAGVIKGSLDLIKKVLYLDPNIFSFIVPPPTPKEVADPAVFFSRLLQN